ASIWCPKSSARRWATTAPWHATWPGRSPTRRCTCIRTWRTRRRYRTRRASTPTSSGCWTDQPARACRPDLGSGPGPSCGQTQRTLEPVEYGYRRDRRQRLAQPGRDGAAEHHHLGTGVHAALHGLMQFAHVGVRIAAEFEYADRQAFDRSQPVGAAVLLDQAAEHVSHRMAEQHHGKASSAL